MEHDNSKHNRAKELGNFLQSLRKGKQLSLRDVEEATDREVSNAYLSQLENGKITRPSPNVLHSLAEVYGTSYPNLMERAGYISPSTTIQRNTAKKHGRILKHGRVSTYSIENLTAEEEAELLKYLAFIRTKRGKP